MASAFKAFNWGESASIVDSAPVGQSLSTVSPPIDMLTTGWNQGIPPYTAKSFCGMIQATSHGVDMKTTTDTTRTRASQQAALLLALGSFFRFLAPSAGSLDLTRRQADDAPNGLGHGGQSGAAQRLAV